MKRLLLAANDLDTIDVIRSYLSDQFEMEIAGTPETCWNKLQTEAIEIAFIDIHFFNPSESDISDTHYAGVITQIQQYSPFIQIVVMAHKKEIRQLVMAVKSGAADYLTYPIKSEEIDLVVRNIIKSIGFKSELEYLRDRFWRSESLHVVRTNNPEMQNVFKKIKSVAPTRATVLLTGETGTGKGVLARLIHQHSSRRNKQFISVHCGAIPETLIESELFGHEKGAFTGAIRRKPGKFEIAHGGTIFLDEINTISPSAQVKLLHVLQDKTYHRVGGEIPVEIDVRIIAASNEDLKHLISENRFRNDLYYRLNVFPIEIPPLRKRREDIPLLLEGYLAELNKYHSKSIHNAHQLVLEAFRNYSWPGNIREFENIVERAYILEKTNTLRPENLPIEFLNPQMMESSIKVNITQPLKDVRRQYADFSECEYLKQVLIDCNGKIGISAKVAGITPRQLNKLLNKHHLDKSSYKSNKISTIRTNSSYNK
ncbi:sigma-54-dependent Fis family transcriptional regulator [bacterium]|nr:sigma-54-dependent Fis family transcriptional regulator [candidate division CSSED10-310 bacterium]